MTTHTAPASITSDGSKDVSRALWHWFNETGNPGDSLKLQPDAKYLTDFSIPLGSTDNVMTGRVIDLNGAHLYRTKRSTTGEEPWGMAGAWPRNNPFFHLRNCTDVEVKSSRPGARLRGPARQVSWYRKPSAQFPAGIARGVEYVAALEAQHGFDLSDLKGKRRNVQIDLGQIEVAFIHGDTVYISGDTDGVEVWGNPVQGIGGGGTISNGLWTPTGWFPGGHHVGRQLLAIGNGRNIVVRDLPLWQGRRSCFDLEPPGRGSLVEHVLLRNCRVGQYRLTFLASKGQGRVNHIEVDGVATDQTLGVVCGQKTIAARTNWWIHNCVGTGKAGSGTPQDPGALMSYRNTAKVLVEHNEQRFDARRFNDVEFIDGASGIVRDNDWIKV